ncbi:F-box protein At3g17710-like [Brassica rapa]|uniref:F-box protein At3g17710-like n=1 Tax=Brassica campestris TaxID=3711 RepID=UPI0004F17C3D|nr:F-box protein At3g17710-like [Brassica rapa]
MTTVKLPWDMEVEILSWLPPRSLVRFRAVCKKWNSLLNDKSFLNQHSSRSRPQFIFLTKSKTYSIDVDLGGAGVGPTIKMCEEVVSVVRPH